jgi:hypothetical protein
MLSPLLRLVLKKPVGPAEPPTCLREAPRPLASSQHLSCMSVA